MSNFKTAIAAENEIMKAVDFTFGYDSSINNVAAGLKAVLSNSEGDYVIGGIVKPYSSGGLNVSISPIYAYKNATDICVAESNATEPISFEEADDSLDRIDIIQVRGIEEPYDSQSRKFNDPSTGTKTTQTVPTKKRIALQVTVKKGSNGSASAPAVDSGFVKLAEVIIPAGTLNITSELIKNIDARKFDVENTEWTANKKATFNPGYLADIFYQFLVGHNEDGTHKHNVIGNNNIDFGTSSTQVKGTDIPSGQSTIIHNADFTSSESLTSLILALTSNVNNLYDYANNFFSRYSFIEDFPVATSTENIDIQTGGEVNIDGIPCLIGQLVFLKDQTDSKENGFYEVQSGSWNRYDGYSAMNPGAFDSKFILSKNGDVNSGKVWILSNENRAIGYDELHFVENKISSFGKPFSFAIRDENGRMKATSPKEETDVAIKQNVTDLNNNLNNHGDSTDGRNLLTVLNVNTVAEAMSKLHIMCNGEGKPDWTLLQIGDYLDLPSLTVNGTTYTWNDEYQNLRIVISGFNQYKNCGDTENTKNHILWGFRNIVLQKRMNATDTNVGGYPASELKVFLDSHFAIGLNAALGGNYIYPISRAISKKGDTTWARETVFLPTTVEVFGVPTYCDDQIGWNTNTQYPIFRNSSFYRCKRINGSRFWWWCASAYSSDSVHFGIVNSYGHSHIATASFSEGGVAPAFCTC